MISPDAASRGQKNFTANVAGGDGGSIVGTPIVSLRDRKRSANAAALGGSGDTEITTEASPAQWTACSTPALAEGGAGRDRDSRSVGGARRRLSPLVGNSWTRRRCCSRARESGSGILGREAKGFRCRPRESVAFDAIGDGADPACATPGALPRERSRGADSAAMARARAFRAADSRRPPHAGRGVRLRGERDIASHGDALRSAAQSQQRWGGTDSLAPVVRPRRARSGTWVESRLRWAVANAHLALGQQQEAESMPAGDRTQAVGPRDGCWDLNNLATASPRSEKALSVYEEGAELATAAGARQEAGTLQRACGTGRGQTSRPWRCRAG
jgi:hypothetical protein